MVSEACLNPQEEAYRSVCVCVRVRARTCTCVQMFHLCVFWGRVYLIRIEVGLSVMSPSPARCAVGSQRVLEPLDTPER